MRTPDQVASKERPILFNGEMVRAILDGRKTQTRRVAIPDSPEIADLRLHADLDADHRPQHYWMSWLPGGQQSHCLVDIGDVLYGQLDGRSDPVATVTTIRVERVQEISNTDVICEGVTQLEASQPGESAWADFDAYYTQAFRDLWDSVANPGVKWADNPWVWVIEFERIDR